MGEGAPTLGSDEDLPLFYMIAGYKYRSAAVITDEPATDAVHLVDGEELHGEPGTRVPHAWVQRDGERISTLDLLGTGFTLFTGPAGAAMGRRGRIRLAVVGRVDHVRPIGVGTDICDVDGQWVKLTGLSPESAMLVRPDDFVAWRADAMA